jgi:hypothetical protein
MKKKSERFLSEQEILQRNPKVNKDLVDGFKKLEIELNELGVNTKPQFTISPPLGNGHLLLSNR